MPYFGTMSERSTEVPLVIYPEDAVDISKLICDERLRYEKVETRGAIAWGLDAIEKGAPLILMGGSTDHEELMTRHGAIALNGHVGAWLLRGEQVALATLWERFPKLRPYLRSRTERWIALKLEEVEMIGGEQGFHAQNCATLRQALELLPVDKD